MADPRAVGPPIVTDLLGRCRFPERAAPLVCAVSGGADSLALLVLAAATGREITAIHVDHRTRPGSESEAALVAEAAHRYGASFRAVQVDVSPGPNLEARARSARYGALPPDVLTGHTADDQAETVLLNLMRGASLDGLAGMRTENRPLIGLRRHETRQLCHEVELQPFDDPSNDDPRHRRNRVRHELMPLLDDIAERDVAPIVARQAALTRDAVDHLAELADALDPTDARALRHAPPSLARIAVRRWVQATAGLAHPIDLAAVDRVLDVANGRAKAADVTAGWQVRRTDSRLRLEHR